MAKKVAAKVSAPKFREPYFQLGDGISALKRVAKTDPTLQNYVERLEAIEKRIRYHLDHNYNWD